MSLSVDLVSAFREIPVTTVYEGQGRTGGMLPAIKPLDPANTVCGPAATVRCAPYDNLALHHAIAELSRGEVLVVDSSQAYDGALFGEIMAAAARARGAAGIVLDALVRDSATIRTLGFPTFCRGVAIRGAGKAADGNRGTPIVCGGVAVSPGDLILGDADGVVVVPAASAHQVLKRARERLDWEERVMAGVREGRTTIQILGLDKKP